MSLFESEIFIFDTQMEKKEFTLLLGQRIKEIRTELGISQSELARRCFKDKQHIQLIESGKVTPTTYNIYLIAKNLQTDINNIFNFVSYKDK